VELRDAQGTGYLLTRSPAQVPPGDYTVKVHSQWVGDTERRGHGPATLSVGPSGAGLELLFHEGPVQGGFHADFFEYDRLLLRYMREKGIPTATLVVSAGGRLLLERAVGTLDAAGTRPAPLTTPMRLASVTKPFTAALIRELVAQGRLSLTTPIFSYLGTQPLPGMTVDPRTADITVEHLLAHRGGWDRAAIGDTMFKGFEVAERLGLTRYPTPSEIARFAMGEALTSAPGAAFAYSNLGYMLLGLAAEKASGKPYHEALTEHVLTPSGIDPADVFPGRGLPQDRDPREPFYADPGQCRDVYRFSKAPPFAPCADGGFHLETLLAHGGLVASGQAVARFMAVFRLDGVRRTGNPSQTHTGVLEGAYTRARWSPTGLDVVVLFNKSRDTLAGGFFNDFEPQLDQAILASPLRP
jgi:N-acyl-D-amino-acid deacylase